MVPWRLPEYREGQRMGLNQFVVRSFGLSELWLQVRMKDPGGRRARLECPNPAQHFAPVVSSHPGWSDLTSPLVYKQIRGMPHFNASIGQVDSTLRVAGKCGEEFFRDRDDLMCLTTRSRYPASKHDILAVAISSAERITGQRSGRRLLRRHNHPAIQAAGERYAYFFT